MVIISNLSIASYLPLLWLLYHKSVNTEEGLVYCKLTVDQSIYHSYGMYTKRKVLCTVS